MKNWPSIFITCGILALAFSACSPPVPIVEGPKVVTVVVVVTPTADGSTIPVTSTQISPTRAPGTDASNDAPQCAILKNVNLRSGPGLVFDPPVHVVRQGDVVTPQGFAPQGFPDGSWIFVSLPGTEEKGWISADASLVDCNVELSGLPSVAAPPTPAPLRVRSSKPEGTPNGINGKVITDPAILLRFQAIGPGGSQDGDHIQKIAFLITDSSGNTVFTHTEQNAPYCIFGGDNTCTPWPKYNGRFVWGEGGNLVESGEYQALITATTDDETGNIEGNWFFTISVEAP